MIQSVMQLVEIKNLYVTTERDLIRMESNIFYQLKRLKKYTTVIFL